MLKYSKLEDTWCFISFLPLYIVSCLSFFLRPLPSHLSLILFSLYFFYAFDRIYMFRGLFQFFAGSTVFWTLCIAVYLYLTVFRMKSLTINEHASEKKYVEFFFSSLLFSSLLFSILLCFVVLCYVMLCLFIFYLFNYYFIYLFLYLFVRRETATMVMFHIIAWGEPLGILIYCYSADLFAQTNSNSLFFFLLLSSPLSSPILLSPCPN